MIGPKQDAQRALFYAFLLEDHVQQDHRRRSIDRYLDLRRVPRPLAVL